MVCERSRNRGMAGPPGQDTVSWPLSPPPRGSRSSGNEAHSLSWDAECCGNGLPLTRDQRMASGNRRPLTRDLVMSYECHGGQRQEPPPSQSASSHVAPPRVPVHGQAPWVEYSHEKRTFLP